MRENQPSNSGMIKDLSALEITKEKFNECAEHALSVIEHVCLKESESKESKHEPPAPALLVYTKKVANDDGQLGDLELNLIVINQGFDSHENKRETLRSIGVAFYLKEVFPVAAFLVCEAWVSTTKDTSITKMPSEDPNRMEVVMVDGGTLKRDEQILIAKQIVRDESGKVTGFKDEIRTTEGRSYIMAPFWNGFMDRNNLKLKGNQ